MSLVALLLSAPPLAHLPTWLDLARSEWNDMPKREAWRRAVPQVEVVEIPATADGSMQPALFYDSGSARPKPLLVVLHSWSADYLQQFSLPYGEWAVEHDWVFVHPDYRGAYTRPQATASELAIQDVLDAVAYAHRHARVDPTRVYLVGFSGGGMTSLILAGRFPELFTAVVAWVPVFDLVQWYEEVDGRYRSYPAHIRNSCGGVPRPGSAAARECRKRSPATYLDNARGKRVRIYVATGLHDPFVSPRHAIAAYNSLADAADRLSTREIDAIASHRRVPPTVAPPVSDPLYSAAGRALLLRRTSANVTLSVFDGRHDVIYGAGLQWLGEQASTPACQELPARGAPDWGHPGRGHPGWGHPGWSGWGPGWGQVVPFDTSKSPNLPP